MWRMLKELQKYLLSLLETNVYVVLFDVPLPEGSSINGYDGSSGEGLGSHQLIVGSVVNGIQDLRLTGDSLTCPGEVSFFIY